jgi:methylenetetrahydrofolate dehydrogenase (NADP+) / methenyltetrahydrofolate cyclohydrolase
MSALILDGRKVSQSIRESLKLEIDKYDKKPGLATILVGHNPASKAYIGMKKKACADIGINSFDYSLTAEDGEAKLIELIQNLNNDDRINGILLQLPLPKGFDEDKMLSIISPEKDVDGFLPENIGKVMIGLPAFKSCTPYGVCEILKYYKIDTNGKHVVIMGRSNIVGKPLAAMLIQKEEGANATVTICHSRTNNLNAITRQADILVAAMGKPLFVKADMVKEGAVVIDVGTNKIDDSSVEKGYRLVGDVDFDSVKEIAGAITPSPGGVGPMTIAMLLKNTLDAYQATAKIAA